MKTQLYLHIVGRLLLLGAIGIIGSYLPDVLRDFFGDQRLATEHPVIDPGWVWGSRHYWYFWTMFLVFITSLINCVVSIVSQVKKYYPNL